MKTQTNEQKYHEFVNLMQSPDTAVLLGRIDRPGTRLFFAVLEHQFYAPDTERAKLYQVAKAELPKDEGFITLICGCIPVADLESAQQAARQSGMRLDTYPELSYPNGYALRQDTESPVRLKSLLEEEAAIANVVAKSLEDQSERMKHA